VREQQKICLKKCKLKKNKKNDYSKTNLLLKKKIVKTYFHLNSELQEGNILFFDSVKVKKMKSFLGYTKLLNGNKK